MKKLKNTRGFTMAELLIVVAIIGILSGVSFISVQKYQRSLGQVERDGIAKEIFVAAQNHLTAAYGASYYGLDVTSNLASGKAFGYKPDGADYYYFVVNNGETGIASPNVFEQMLPFGAIDETVRKGGSFIIRYNKDVGLVLDVFYCSTSGVHTEYNHSLAQSDLNTVLGLRDSKSGRQNWDGSILGFCKGIDDLVIQNTAPTLSLEAPSIKIVNKEMLYVEVTDPNYNKITSSRYNLKLIISGKDSTAQKVYVLDFNAAGNNRISFDSISKTYTVVLDDITSNGRSFGWIQADNGAFKWGEDVEIYAVAFSSTEISNIAYSTTGTTNSLFERINDGKDTAYIENIRHLENLDKEISCKYNTTSVGISSAEQTSNLSWTDFQTAINGSPLNASGVTSIFYTPSGGGSLVSNTTTGYYKPVSPNYSLSYDGKNYNVSDIKVTGFADAGFFGKTTSVSAISNLELIDFDITGTATAGALAGDISGCAVTNVLARNSSDVGTVSVTAPVAGGLIGNYGGGTLSYSAAALIVSGSSKAGGLAGSAGGTITACYSGGHTKDGSYKKWVTPVGSNPYDVTSDSGSGIAGGLIGESSATITNSYSTCSVSGATAGGFIGSATGGSVTGSYCTGLIGPVTSPITTATTSKFAFIGSGTPTLSGNYYYSVVNEWTDATDSNYVTDLDPVNGYDEENDQALVKALDYDLTTLKGFVSKVNDARAYDPWLVQYYEKKYYLKTVKALGSTPPETTYFVNTHYGDWPAPETLVVN